MNCFNSPKKQQQQQNNCLNFILMSTVFTPGGNQSNFHFWVFDGHLLCVCSRSKFEKKHLKKECQWRIRYTFRLLYRRLYSPTWRRGTKKSKWMIKMDMWLDVIHHHSPRGVILSERIRRRYHFFCVNPKHAASIWRAIGPIFRKKPDRFLGFFFRRVKMVI